MSKKKKQQAAVTSMGTPRERLDDVVSNGLAIDIFQAEESLAVVEVLKKYWTVITKASLGNTFYALRIIVDRHAILAVNRLFEPPDLRYPLRSIPVAIQILADHADDLSPLNRETVEKQLMAFGCINCSNLPAPDLTRRLAAEFDKQNPRNAASSEFSKALEYLKAARDKKIAHNESIDTNVPPLTTPTYDEMKQLLKYAKKFVITIGTGYLKINYNANWEESLFPANETLETSAGLERLFTQLNRLATS